LAALTANVDVHLYGDENQRIYQFLGDVGRLDRFLEHIVTRISLERTYRLPAVIVDVASAMLDFIDVTYDGKLQNKEIETGLDVEGSVVSRNDFLANFNDLYSQTGLTAVITRKNDSIYDFLVSSVLPGQNMHWYIPNHKVNLFLLV
jgi:hypothetical protein